MKAMKALNCIAILLLLSLTACTTPQRQPISRPTPPSPPQSAPVAATPEQPKDYFTLGSTMDEVASLMGTPQTVNNLYNEVWWYYGYSKVTFKQGRVTEWDNNANNLKVRWSASTPTQQATPSPDARKIDAQVATIIAGEHNPLPPAQHVRSNPAAQVAEMVSKNNTQYTLTVLYSGPTSQRVVLAPQATQKVVLSVGTYQVAATVDSPSVIPFAGRDDIRGGGYDNTFYIKTTSR